MKHDAPPKRDQVPKRLHGEGGVRASASICSDSNGHLNVFVSLWIGKRRIR